MQKLCYEAAWDRTLASKDRKRIETVFNALKLSSSETVQFTTLWQASNYKDELLVTALIHNTGNIGFCFQDTHLQYQVAGIVIADHNFTIPIQIGANESTPWTFIFPAGRFQLHSHNKCGEIILIN